MQVGGRGCGWGSASPDQFQPRKMFALRRRRRASHVLIDADVLQCPCTSWWQPEPMLYPTLPSHPRRSAAGARPGSHQGARLDGRRDAWGGAAGWGAVVGQHAALQVRGKEGPLVGTLQAQALRERQQCWRPLRCPTFLPAQRWCAHRSALLPSPYQECRVAVGGRPRASRPCVGSRDVRAEHG